MKSRTFIAVAINKQVRQHALELAQRLEPLTGEVRWVTAENLHWTLQFLGEIDENQIPEVCDCVGRAAADAESFDLTVTGAGAFPSADRPKTLWLGAGEGSEAMCQLQAAIEQRLCDRGYRGESRRYVPHLTIGRAGRDSRSGALAAELAALADYDAGKMLVDEVTVFTSKLRREGPEYRAVGRLPLGV